MEVTPFWEVTKIVCVTQDIVPGIEYIHMAKDMAGKSSQ